jgi:release factor glutamine methyltransferase
MHKCENIDEISISGLLDWAKHLIQAQHDLMFQAPPLEARLLFTFATKENHTWQITYGNQAATQHLSKEQIALYVKVVNQRLRGTPIAFILGTQEFWSLTLKVSKCTLIPRQDTEILVETALSLPLPYSACALDLGTGTGAIALALAKERKQWQVLGIDKVAQAVELARENALLNNVQAVFLQSDWFSALDTHEGRKTFDIIVTNPPYVEEDSNCVAQGDLRFEPLSALVSGKDGLDDIRHIIRQAKPYLNEDGYLLIEHGAGQYKNVQSLLKHAGFVEIRSVADINQIQRITLGKSIITTS